MKIHISARIDEEIIGGIERSAQKRAVSKSEIIERALSLYLAKDSELTATERKHYQKVVIEMALDRVSGMLGAHFEGDLKAKCEANIAFVAGFYTTNPLRQSGKIAELSLFEILRDIRDYDRSLFNELTPVMKRFKRLNSHLTQLHIMDEGSVTL